MSLSLVLLVFALHPLTYISNKKYKMAVILASSLILVYAIKLNLSSLLIKLQFDVSATKSKRVHVGHGV
jgi:hypothetical protein